jgi:hypothetical protein
MSDRHQELLRQHKLFREHLAWLEREITREASSPPASATTTAIVSPTGIQSRVTSPAEADLLQDYVAAERHDPASTKRGCLLAFAAGLGLLFASVITVYFLFYTHR